MSGDTAADTTADEGASEAIEEAAEDAPGETVAPRTFTLVTFNTGTTDNLSHAGDPDGYTDAMAGIEASFYGNNLAWMKAQQALRTMLETLQPDVLAFQELYYDGLCTDDCAGAQASDPALFASACQGTEWACGTWTEDAPITVRRILPDGYAVACAPGHPDNCVAVRKAFGTLKDCDDGPCIDGLDGRPPQNGCTGGARVATAVVQVTDGPEIAVVDVHTVAGTNQDCRKAQFQQVFEDRGDGKPAAFCAHNIVAGDMNIDPFLMQYDVSVDYWNQHVGEGRPFHYLSSSSQEGPDTHPWSFMKLDHVVSDSLQGSCVVLGVTEGTAAPLSEGSTYFDHRPVLCTVTLP